MDRGRVRLTTTTTSRILQLIRSLGLQRTSLIFDIHVMVNKHLSKQGIRRPVSCDHIAGSGLWLIKVMWFRKLTAGQVHVFDWVAVSYQVNLL